MTLMKTLTVREAKSKLENLVDKVQRGGPVILIQGNKLAKLERYDLLDPEFDSPQLEAMLLEAVEGPHSPYSRKEMDAILRKVHKETRRT
jgi:hypothetical protein